MTKLMIAAAALGLSVAPAAAECSWKHSAEAKTDPTVTASVTTPANMSVPVTVDTEPKTPVPQEEK